MANNKSKNPSTTQSLMEEFRRQRRNFLKLWAPSLIILVIGFVIAAQFIQPAPPDHVVLSTGSAEGAYHTFAAEYAEYFKKQGITLEPRTSAGSVENVQRLLESNRDEDDNAKSKTNAKTGDLPISVAIVQGGVGTPEAQQKLRTVASLYLEPVWVFYRGDTELTQLRQLKDKRIAVGTEGSGTRQLAMTLLRDNGVAPAIDEFRTVDTSQFLALNTVDSAAAIQAGEIDAAVFVISPHATTIRELIANPDVHLMSFERDAAYPRRHPYISTVTLPRGVLDPAADLPRTDVHLIAPAANLVVHEDIHSALIPLFIEAARKVHDRGGLVTDPGAFPSLKFAELPVHDEARRYFQDGPSFLHRYLPFWMAAFIERSWVMLLPLLTLLIPLVKLAPPVYRWRIRVRIYRWYRVVRAIDQHLGPQADTDLLREDLEKLLRLENEVADVWVPLSYMEEFYNLRLHIAFVHRRVQRAMTGQPIKSDDDPLTTLNVELPEES